jgi:hypothetical protein
MCTFELQTDQIARLCHTYLFANPSGLGKQPFRILMRKRDRRSDAVTRAVAI